MQPETYTPELCLETRDLTFAFSSKENVLEGVRLRVETGSIYGFLGPNGAGKTTTLRLILGLLNNQHGEISFFGQPFRENRIKILRQVGSLIETPSLYGHLTATENLRIMQRIHQCHASQIQDVLRMVGLPGTGNKKASQFSLGMKQRLGIGIALLHNPRLLILDEPTNGLDPNGMIEVRELLKKLNQENGITIIISSHLLAEIDKLVTDVGIINKGRMMFQGTLEELKSKQQQSVSVRLDTNDISRTVQLLADLGLKTSVDNGKIVLPAMSRERVSAINQNLVNAGIAVYEISRVNNDLESIFMDLINH